MASLILTESADGVFRLTINRPEVRNPLNDQVMAEIGEAILEAQADSANRVIVITGAGDKAFCAGGDLKPGAKTFNFDHSNPRSPMAQMFRIVRRCDLPIVARVNGHCLAGGMGILAMCDMAVASNKALFGMPEVKIGMFPMQIAVLLMRLTNRRIFEEMCITGEPISADEAKAVGLVNHVVDPAELDAKVDWLVSRIIDKSPTAIRRGKYALHASEDMSVEQALAYMENQIMSLALTEDAIEGLASFNEKRKPVWTGR
jgi:enoyl-CoA hydratase/carnithine racemase